jgi:hypothetical protein
MPLSRQIFFYLLPLTTLLIAITAVLTPLGLKEAILPMQKASTITNKQFGYIKDISALGQGTPPRSELGFNRNCKWEINLPCPGVDVVKSDFQNGTYLPDRYTNPVPEFLIERFQSGLTHHNGSVSSIFDIQWRAFDTINPPTGPSYLLPRFKQFTSVLLNDDVELFEGVIVDTKTGGIGFRNHSVPPHTQYGSTWEEDILFLSPETQCVDTNLSIRFGYSDSHPSKMTGFFLEDMGGLSDLDLDYEWWMPEQSQDRFDIHDRAFRGAWLNNYITKNYFTDNNISVTASEYTGRPSYDVTTQSQHQNSILESYAYGLNIMPFLPVVPVLSGGGSYYHGLTNNSTYVPRTEIDWKFNGTLPGKFSSLVLDRQNPKGI